MVVAWKCCSNFCLLFLTIQNCFNGQQMELISLKWVWFDLDINRWSIFLSLSQPMSFFNLFSPSVLLRRGNERVAGWAFGCLPEPTHQTFLKGSTYGLLCQLHHHFSGPVQGKIDHPVLGRMSANSKLAFSSAPKEFPSILFLNPPLVLTNTWRYFAQSFLVTLIIKWF